MLPYVREVLVRLKDFIVEYDACQEQFHRATVEQRSCAQELSVREAERQALIQITEHWCGSTLTEYKDKEVLECALTALRLCRKGGG
jgi:hypothetical protein